jgi:LysR family transcriptional regulator, hydrogen peroxide-inducible genes activator
MTLAQLEYALAVQEHLNFQRAAEACHIAQPSLSAQIKKLEEHLGITLFQRSANSGVMVTDMGRQALEQARLVIDEAKKLQDLCANFKDEVSGILRVGVIPTVGPFLLPLFLEKLKKSHPGMQLEILEKPTKDLMEELHYGRLDVAILSPPAKAPAHLIEKLLCYEPFLVYGAKGHPILQEKNIKLSTLSEYAVTLLDETHCMRDQVVSACSRGNKNVSELQLKQGSLQTLISLVESQQSFTLIPQLAEPVLHLKYRRSLQKTQPDLQHQLGSKENG